MDLIIDSYGGRNPEKDFMHYSNIAFTNGMLDPWRAGGLTHNLTSNEKITTFLMEGGAHHLDLRAPNPADPEAVKNARASIT